MHNVITMQYITANLTKKISTQPSIDGYPNILTYAFDVVCWVYFIAGFTEAFALRCIILIGRDAELLTC